MRYTEHLSCALLHPRTWAQTKVTTMMAVTVTLVLNLISEILRVLAKFYGIYSVARGLMQYTRL